MYLVFGVSWQTWDTSQGDFWTTPVILYLHNFKPIVLLQSYITIYSAEKERRQTDIPVAFPGNQVALEALGVCGPKALAIPLFVGQYFSFGYLWLCK